MWTRKSHTLGLYNLTIQRCLKIEIPLTQRTFSQAASVAAEQDRQEPNAEEYPQPDPKYAEIIRALPREGSGRLVAAKLRAKGRIPSIVFEGESGDKGNNKRLISVETKQIRNLLRKVGESSLLSRTFDIEVKAGPDSEEIVEKGRVLPRLIHINRGTDEIVNVTFIRAPPSALLKVDVPLLYRGEDACPGIRKGGYLNTIRRTVKFLCPADLIPRYIDVDISELDVGQKLLMRDLKVHPLLKLLKAGEEWPICTIMGSKFKAQQPGS